MGYKLPPASSLTTVPGSPAPQRVLRTLLPCLGATKTCTRRVRTRVRTRPSGSNGNSGFFTSTLDSTSLSVRAVVRIILLKLFPRIHFFNRRFRRACGAHCFHTVSLKSVKSCLVALSPVSNARFCLSNRSGCRVVLDVLGTSRCRTTVTIAPNRRLCCCTLQNRNAFHNRLDSKLRSYIHLAVSQPTGTVYLN